MSTLRCNDVRLELRDLRRGRHVIDREHALRQHLLQCQDCSRVADAEERLDEALSRLPSYALPASLKESLAPTLGMSTEARSDPQAPSRSREPVVKTFPWHPLATYAGWIVAALLSVALVLSLSKIDRHPTGALPREVDRLVGEAVGDHLRLLYAEHPLEIASGGIHQVKPWFSGKLAFAPILSFEGDDEFPLQGGAVAYFVDRKAATFIYKRRLHTISLFVVEEAGLPWPTDHLEAIGPVHAHVESSRGFNVVAWKTGELGYVLVSDVSSADLRQLASRIAGGP